MANVESPAPAFILASASPRRKDLLRSAGLTFEVDPSDVPEDALDGESPSRYVRRVARGKGQAVARRRRSAGDTRAVLSADTVVVVGDEITGKPVDREDARSMLWTLSGKTHVVITGFCIIHGEGDPVQQEVATEVRFRQLTEADLEAYLDSGDWQDKAGAYAIQGGAAQMVASIHGSYTNVVGLPLAEVITALRAVGKNKE